MAIEVLGLAGSLRKESLNRRLLLAATHELPPNAQLRTYDDLAAVPAYNEDIDVEPAPGPVEALRRAVAAADAILIATPEYNHSVPGQLKNVLDWLSRPWASPPLASKPSAVIGASLSAFGAVWAQAETRKVLAAIRATVVDDELPVAHAAEAFGADERLVNSDHRAKLAEILSALVGSAEASHRTPREAVA